MDYGGRKSGALPQGMKSMVPPSQAWSPDGAHAAFPKCWLTAPLTISLTACHGILSCPIQDCVSNWGGGQEISLSPWGLLGIAGSLEQLPAAAGDREPRNACASLAFLGPTVLPLKSLGSTRPHSGPHCWYILSHYERNLERDDSGFE